MDVDGVLTDGRLYFSEHGEQIKVFHVRDGQGLVTFHSAGFRSGVISGRSSPIVDVRLKQLGVEFVWQGRNDKVSALNEIVAAAEVNFNEVAYIGDDMPDADVFPITGLGVAVADAHESARAAAHYVTKLNGGCGAVREVIDLILFAQHRQA
jgi:3-deoxy-D-manno-octulosonate 8-phosphate phosphatase (KDO 8-P phosphatase)